jgi:DNA-binding CsgD family transcriptional regulator
MASRRPRERRGRLRDRRREREALDRLLEAARAGRSGALVVRGQPGIGKTALLGYTVESASDFRMARATGVESEMELAFAALHQLCSPMLDRLDRLATPQRNALAAAFGLSADGSPDRFLVGLAVLSLLCDAAGKRPLLCVVDDAQWLDQASAQTLAFVARRLGAESVALVIAVTVREPSQAAEFAGLPELLVEGLSATDARALLASVMPGPLDESVRDRIVCEAKGNPLALLELPRGLTPAELAGGFGLPRTLPLASRIEDCYLRQAQALPAETQRLLLLAAAEPVGDPVLLWRAAERLGIGVEAAAPAEAAGLLRLNDRVEFRHPLCRSAVYWAAALADRRSAHGALAGATDPKADPDRRAWHRAAATVEPDEEVADELERSAGRAQARGGLAATAAFLERAAGLTPEPARRAARQLAAARAKLAAGAPNAASELLARAGAGPLDELQRAQLERLLAHIEFILGRGSGAPPLLLSAARRLERLDVRIARETYLEALEAALFAGRLGSRHGVLEAAETARAAPPAREPPSVVDLLLDGLAALLTEGYAAGVPMLRRALTALGGEHVLRRLLPASTIAVEMWDDEAAMVRRLLPASTIAVEMWDDEAAVALATRWVQLARDAGALSVLPMALISLANLWVRAGDFAGATELVEEASAITAATGNEPIVSGPLVLAAWRGQDQGTSELIEASIQDANARGEGMVVTLTEYATTVLQNGLGRHRAAFAAAQRACQYEDLLSAWVLPELIEAAARSGERELAADAVRRLSERTRVCGTEWALGTEARSRALLSEGEVTERLYREAIGRLGRCRAATDLARAHLLFGEWLRRERRRLEAREQLRTALEMFASMGAEAFAARAARELRATGEHARRRTAQTMSQLTAQEAQIARLACEGHSNPEIGARLFISSRTVEYHLHKVFTKTNITSRSQLDRVLPVAAGQVSSGSVRSISTPEPATVRDGSTRR